MCDQQLKIAVALGSDFWISDFLSSVMNQERSIFDSEFLEIRNIILAYSLLKKYAVILKKDFNRCFEAFVNTTSALELHISSILNDDGSHRFILSNLLFQDYGRSWKSLLKKLSLVNISIFAWIPGSNDLFESVQALLQLACWFG